MGPPSFSPLAQALSALVFITCSPGTTISLNVGSSGLEVTASATLDGRSIPQVGGICGGSSTPPCAFPGFEFRGQAVVPPFGDFTKAIVKAPVDFSGFLIALFDLVRIYRSQR